MALTASTIKQEKNRALLYLFVCILSNIHCIRYIANVGFR